MWTIEELEFILYNNRSVKGVVTNFLPKDVNPLDIVKIEERLDEAKKGYDTNRSIVIDKKYLNLKAHDIIVTPSDLDEVYPQIKKNIGSFSDAEYEYLVSRGLGDKAINDLKLMGLSSIRNKDILDILGISVHPMLKGFLNDGVENGGIVIPLIVNSKLINCATRKLSINTDFMSDKVKNTPGYQSLKYSIACPDVSVWGLDRITQNSEIWLCEGIFDMYALTLMGKNAVSFSTAMGSSLQYNQILQKKPSHIYIFSDSDMVGLRTAAQIKNFFELYDIETTTLISKHAKDAAEHYFQRFKTIDDLVEIDITHDMVDGNQGDLDIVSYLLNRKF